MYVNSKSVDNFNLNLTIEIWNLRQDFGEVKFIQIFREENSRADSLVNRELDSQNRQVISRILYLAIICLGL